jgi:thioredoxin-dependent peroxiredoxin
VSDQAKFKAKEHLPYPLLADATHEIAEAYGVWVEKSMYGKNYFGVERSTFIIDAAGMIEKIFRKVKPETHSEQVLAALAE